MAVEDNPCEIGRERESVYKSFPALELGEFEVYFQEVDFLGAAADELGVVLGEEHLEDVGGGSSSSGHFGLSLASLLESTGLDFLYIVDKDVVLLVHAGSCDPVAGAIEADLIYALLQVALDDYECLIGGAVPDCQ